MGDFNIDLLSGLTLSNLILQPTRITDHSETIIDNIFFNSTDYTDTDTDISQHTPYQGFSVTGYIMNR